MLNVLVRGMCVKNINITIIKCSAKYENIIGYKLDIINNTSVKGKKAR